MDNEEDQSMASLDQSVNEEDEIAAPAEKEDETKKKEKGKIMTDENEENIRINFATWRRFYTTYYGYVFYLALIFTCSLMIISKAANDYIIGHWALSEDQISNFGYYGTLSVLLAFTTGFSVGLRALSNWSFTIRASRKLHE